MRALSRGKKMVKGKGLVEVFFLDGSDAGRSACLATPLGGRQVPGAAAADGDPAVKRRSESDPNSFSEACLHLLERAVVKPPQWNRFSVDLPLGPDRKRDSLVLPTARVGIRTGARSGAHGAAAEENSVGPLPRGGAPPDREAAVAVSVPLAEGQAVAGGETWPEAETDAASQFWAVDPTCWSLDDPCPQGRRVAFADGDADDDAAAVAPGPEASAGAWPGSPLPRGSHFESSGGGANSSAGLPLGRRAHSMEASWMPRGGAGSGRPVLQSLAEGRETGRASTDSAAE